MIVCRILGSMVSLAGTACGIVIESADNKVDGLVIKQFLLRVFLCPEPLASGNTITCCYLGVDASGLAAAPNYEGVHITNSASGNIVGPDNVVSGNSSSVL